MSRQGLEMKYMIYIFMGIAILLTILGCLSLVAPSPDQTAALNGIALVVAGLVFAVLSLHFKKD